MREALRLQPDFANAHDSLGHLLNRLGRWEEAEASVRTALRLNPQAANAHVTLGHIFRQVGRADEAQASYRAALSLRPDNANCHAALGLALLLAGDFEAGWEEYEWRWRARGMVGERNRFPVPSWNGDPIGDRTILLHAEQGHGDTLQFCRYVPQIASTARTVLEVQPPLARLLSRMPGPIVTVAGGDPLPAFDLHCPLMSLPRATGTTITTIPGTTPYLAADPADIVRWRARLAGLSGLRVGLCWAGGGDADPLTDARRSIALEMLSPLAEISGVSFVSLQKGRPAAQATNPPGGMTLHDFTDELNDFADTAALIDCLDLVISVDTAVAHLAGALDKPVWLLNRFDSCFRWLLSRDDSPWYPRLRQFRQPTPGDWSRVVGRARDALQRLAAGDARQLSPIGAPR